MSKKVNVGNDGKPVVYYKLEVARLYANHPVHGTQVRVTEDTLGMRCVTTGRAVEAKDDGTKCQGCAFDCGKVREDVCDKVGCAPGWRFKLVSATHSDPVIKA